MSVSCPYCHAAGSVADRFCIHCGEPQPARNPQRSCPYCNRGNSSTNTFCVHCGKLLRAPLKRINGYVYIREIGHGGMGKTYLASHMRYPRCVVKEMNADMTNVQKAHELFEREAGVLKSLSHPGVPAFYDYFMETNKKYLVMEVVFGENLQNLQEKNGCFDVRDAVSWVADVCGILEYLHEKGVIHRDVKPANLMLRHHPREIVLIDFGAVKEIGTRPGTVIGSGCFCAPEQRQGQPTKQSDIYSLGVTLLALLTGKDPEDLYDTAVDRFLPLDRYLHGAARRIVERATHRDPTERYSDVGQLRQELECLLVL